MTMKTKILFLDIDNVLNTSPQPDGFYMSTDYESDKLVCPYVPILKDNFNALKFIYDNVEDLKTVWSTGWRYESGVTWNSWECPIDWLESVDWLQRSVIGCTPFKMHIRPEEIYLWLRDNRCSKQSGKKHFDICSYAIVDDYKSPLMDKFGKHLFNTQYDIGLDMKMARSIAKLLNTESYNEDELVWQEIEDSIKQETAI